MFVGARLRQLARWDPDAIALVDDKGSWTRRAFVSRIARFGAALRGLGLDSGDRVALLVPDRREYLEADYAIMSAGLVRVPLDPRLPRKDIVALLTFAGARVLVVDAAFAERAEDLAKDIPGLVHVIGIGGLLRGALDYEDLIAKASDQFAWDGDGEDLATLNFSGGTTGTPKAIMLRHRNLMAAAQNTILGFDIRPDAMFLNVRPLWPIAQIILMSYVLAGATITLGGRFEPEGLARLVKRSGANRTSLVPTQLVRCVDHIVPGDEQLARLEAIHVGGSRIPPSIFERALDVIGPRIGVLYGLTEAPVTCYLPPETLAGPGRLVMTESVGRELFGYRVRLDGADPADRDVTGEVLISGGNVMAGYWRDASSTDAALRDGWLHTGDIGRFDEAGNLFIVGRLKEVIRSGASSIVPKEVEDVLLLHPAVAEAAVIGLPDVEWGESVTAFIVLASGATASEADLLAHCKAHLASYKKPRSIRFIDHLPRSHYGKVLSAQLRAMDA